MSYKARGAPLSAGVTHNPPPSNALVNEMYLPSGDQKVKNPSARRRAGAHVPSSPRRVTHTPPVGPSTLNDRLRPSGDQRAIISFAGVCAAATTGPPSSGSTKTSRDPPRIEWNDTSD